MSAINKFLTWLNEEIGYLEKKNNDLDYLFDKTANAGTANFTKYAYVLDTKYPDVMNGNKNGYPWCACFYVCGIMETFGQSLGMKMLYLPKESLAAGCGENQGQAYYKEQNKLFKYPQVGDQVYFSTQHTGAVVKVQGNQFWTIEGNTSGGNTVISNGGSVCYKGPYTVSTSYSFGRPDWKLADSGYQEPEIIVMVQQGDIGPDVLNVQKQLLTLGYDLGISGADGDFGQKTTKAVIDFQIKNDLKPDGIVGPATYAALIEAVEELKTPKATLQKGSNGEKVRILQNKLIALGFVECGTPDGGFGDKTELAVKNFQKNYGITADGVVGSETETAINFCVDKINEGVFGVDVSTYQKNMKFENTPAKFAIIRAGYTSRSTGTQNKDNAFEDLYSQAKAEGLNVGVYWYSLAKSAEDAIAEAEFLYNNCLKGKQFELPIYLDVEEKAQLALGKEKLTEIIGTWLDYLSNLNYCVGIYTSTSIFSTYIDTKTLKCEYWVAQWAKNCSSSLDYGMWQFGGESNKLRKPELDGMVCDQDLMLKDYPALIKAKQQNGFGPTTSNPSPVDKPMKPYTAIVMADLLNVRVRPSIDSPRVAVLKKYTPVKILEERNEWGKIQYKGSVKWIMLQFIKKK